MLAALRFRAELNLFKLRTGRNIAGLQRQVDPYAAPIEAEAALPGIGAGGQIALPGAAALQPTPYRYPLLIERARQLAQLAAQMEAAMLAAFEKRDAELYNLLKARQDVKLTRAGVRLQDLRVREADDGVRLAQLQQERAQFQAGYFESQLDQGLLRSEELALNLMIVASGLGLFSAAASFAIGALGVAQGFGALSSATSSLASYTSAIASYERRRQEWEFQQVLATRDVGIAAQQIRLADDHVRIAGQERLIADLQADHAEASLDFLAGKFTSAELYDWMSGILGGRLQLFPPAGDRHGEARREPARLRAPGAAARPHPGGLLAGDRRCRRPRRPGTRDRRGMTGSARLLAGHLQLDQHAFETDKRRLQLTRTFSLARARPDRVPAVPRHRRARRSPRRGAVRPRLSRPLPASGQARADVGDRAHPADRGHPRDALRTAGDLARRDRRRRTFPTTVVRRDPQIVRPELAPGRERIVRAGPFQPELLLPFEGSGWTPSGVSSCPRRPTRSTTPRSPTCC